MSSYSVLLITNYLDAASGGILPLVAAVVEVRDVVEVPLLLLEEVNAGGAPVLPAVVLELVLAVEVLHTEFYVFVDIFFEARVNRKTWRRCGPDHTEGVQNVTAR